jgi:O-acetyl-ADP-ribose deacetylase (regulator of RNase III)
MPLEIIRNDITKVAVDAIVNAANPALNGGGGVDGAIHEAAGPELLQACQLLGGCQVTEAKITGGYRLKAKYVIHTVGPIWRDGKHHEAQLLRECYLNALRLAQTYQLTSIAFPLIASGIFGYPKAKALKVAVDAIKEFLVDHDMMIYLVVYDRDTVLVTKQQFNLIDEYITDHYVDQSMIRKSKLMMSKLSGVTSHELVSNKQAETVVLHSTSEVGDSLMELMARLGETFTSRLLRLIDERGLSDPDVYVRANMDRRLFSKIRSDNDYHPHKLTVLALAIALELNLDQTEDLLMRAGYALSSSSKTDLIVKYHIVHRKFDIHAVNFALYSFNERTLGSVA